MNRSSSRPRAAVRAGGQRGGRGLPLPTAWSTRELDEDTWKDFQRLFERYGGVQAGCWCMFYHREGPVHGLSEKARTEQNRKDHRRWMREGRAHGVLVYREGEVVGWCQFGPREELPRLERGRTYRGLELPAPKGRLWRITCFFVDRPARRQGVSRRALHAALEAVSRHGGGTVEAFPVTHPRAVSIWFGTIAMYEREGFHKVSSFGPSHWLMRREVSAGGPSSLPAARI